jgi:hypothetical protein
LEEGGYSGGTEISISSYIRGGKEGEKGAVVNFASQHEKQIPRPVSRSTEDAF